MSPKTVGRHTSSQNQREVWWITASVAESSGLTSGWGSSILLKTVTILIRKPIRSISAQESDSWDTMPSSSTPTIGVSEDGRSLFLLSVSATWDREALNKHPYPLPSPWEEFVRDTEDPNANPEPKAGGSTITETPTSAPSSWVWVITKSGAPTQQPGTH